MRVLCWIMVAHAGPSLTWEDIEAAKAPAPISIQVDHPRPLQDVLARLAKEFGVFTTYEDVWPLPPSKQEVRVPGGDPLPIGGRLDIQVPAEDLKHPARLVQHVVDLHHAAGHPGTFQVSAQGARIHVLPVTHPTEAGEAPVTRLLDTPVDVSGRGINALQIAQAITEELSLRTDKQVSLYPWSTHPALQEPLPATARPEGPMPARKALALALDGVSGIRVSWQLISTPDGLQHGLNLFTLCDPTETEAVLCPGG